MHEPELPRKPELTMLGLGCGRLPYRLHARRARQQTIPQCDDGHGANCNSRDHWECERLCLSTFGPLTHIFPQVTMPGRGSQQKLRNFEAMSPRLEPSAMVNAELLFGNIKVGSNA
jgi:hypothetical protein